MNVQGVFLLGNTDASAEMENVLDRKVAMYDTFPVPVFIGLMKS